MKIAITVDELILWDGTPMPPGYTAATVMDGMLRAFREHRVAGVYGFAHTSPVADRPDDREILERWCAAGHHLGNHTHHHACLNWVGAQRYCDDVRLAEDVLGDLLEAAPTRYFRHAMDMTGPSEARRGEVEGFLRAQRYTTAPITAWFGDFAWTAPYARALHAGDRDAAAMLRTSFVEAAVARLHDHAEAGRRLFGADLPLIWLVHGTALAQDVLGEILQRFADDGVELIPLDDAMRHPVHRVHSPVTPLFRNHLERIALAAGDEVPAPPPEAVAQVITSGLAEGEDPMAVYDAILRRIVDRVDGTWNWSWA